MVMVNLYIIHNQLQKPKINDVNKKIRGDVKISNQQNGLMIFWS